MDALKRWRAPVLGGLAALLALVLAWWRFRGAGRDDVFLTLWAGEQLAAGRGMVNHDGTPVEVSSSLLHTWIVAALARADLAPVYVANKLAGLAALAATIGLLTSARARLFSARVSPATQLVSHGPALRRCCRRGRPSLPRIGRARRGRPLPPPPTGGAAPPARETASTPARNAQESSCSRPERGGLVALAVALAIVATTPSFLYWSLGGLETPFVALLWVAITIAALRCWDRPSRRAALALGAALSLLVLARPEGLLALLVPAAMLALRRSSGRALAPALLLPAAVFAALSLWRLARFGAVWPNPVLAKASLSFASLRAGAAYLGAFLTSSVLMAVLGAVLAARVLTAAAALARGRASREEARRELVLLSPSVLILTQSVAVGGDWMEFFRFLQPAVPLLAVSLGGLVAGAWVRSGGAVRSALVAVLVGLLASNLAQRDAVQAPGGWTMRSCAGEASPGAPLELWNLVYARDARELFPFLDAQAHELAARAGGGLVIATPQMGQLPYHLRRRMPALDVRFVDTRGLCDSDLARLDVPKGPFGLAAGGELAAILAGERGALSDAVRARGPNLLYQVRMSDAEIEQLEALGFELVHRGAHAVLLLRASETPR